MKKSVPFFFNLQSLDDYANKTFDFCLTLNNAQIKDMIMPNKKLAKINNIRNTCKLL